jgi:hypothetical protein
MYVKSLLPQATLNGMVQIKTALDHPSLTDIKSDIHNQILGNVLLNHYGHSLIYVNGA